MVQKKPVWVLGVLVLLIGLILVPSFTIADDDEDECESVFPGDGAGDGPPLRYRDNRNGTITDQNTELVWEKKLAADDDRCTDPDQAERSVHCVNNKYSWNDTGDDTIPDGTLFTEFLPGLNNRCERDDSLSCTRNRDCRAVGGKCGFAGKRDWHVQNIKELQSIMDYGRCATHFQHPLCDDQAAMDPVFSPVDPEDYYWSSTPSVRALYVWSADFSDGGVFAWHNVNVFHARAVRGCR